MNDTAEMRIITNFRQVQGVWTIRLDYVEVRDCNRDDCPAGREISNQNPLLRTFRFTPSTKIFLLKSAGVYFQATPSSSLREIIGLRQMYLP